MMRATFVLLCVFFFGLAIAYCPNGCSAPNGVCSAAEVCQCQEGWAGDDCSIPDVQLRSGVPVEGEVLTRQWSYYHFLANSQQASVTFEINQTSQGGDLDAYVRLDKYPTRQVYDMRDISTSKNMKFEIPSPHGVYYVGVYGFLRGSYSIQASLKTSCPNDCSGHGVCSFDGTCACRTGWGSHDCSQMVPLLTAEPVNGEVAMRQWNYYRLVNDQNTINLTLSVADATQDCDLYVKKGELPSFTTWDYRDTTQLPSFTLNIAQAEPGEYYIGVVGYTDLSQYTIFGTVSSECPNWCSGENHGTCSETYECACAEGYSGEACGTKDYPLQQGVIEEGRVGGNVWNYYHFSTATSSNVVVRLTEKNEGADCDLYIRNGAEPTKVDFDMRDISFSDVVELVIENPSINLWYVGVFGYKTCEYEVSFSLSGNCPNDCSGNGECGQVFFPFLCIFVFVNNLCFES